MSAGESILRILAAMKPLLPGMLIAVAATMIALVVLSAMSRHAWVDQKRFSLPSLFFSLDGKGTLRLACTWLKLIFMVVFLVSFQKLVLIQYLMIVIPGGILVVLAGRVREVFSGLLWFALQLLGLLCSNLVCGYILDMDAGIEFLLIYIVIGVFEGLFSLYLFMLDLESISGSRIIDAHKTWRITEDEEEQ